MIPILKNKTKFKSLRLFCTTEMKHGNILSIDIGIRNFGFCFYDPNTKKIINWGTRNLTPSKSSDFIMSACNFFKDFEKEESKLFESVGSVVIEQQIRGNMRIIEAIIYTFFFPRYQTEILNTKKVFFYLKFFKRFFQNFLILLFRLKLTLNKFFQ
jgi:hypothetical protein